MARIIDTYQTIEYIYRMGRSSANSAIRFILPLSILVESFPI